MKDKLTASEAVYGFAGWLTTRDNETVMSAHHDAAPIADLVKLFCEEYKFNPPRATYHKRLKRITEPINSGL